MVKLGDVKLKTKFMIVFLLVGIAPLAVMGIISLIEASSALQEQAFNQLVAVRQIKKEQLEDYFARTFTEMGVFSRTRDIAELYDKLAEYHEKTGVRADGPYDVTTVEYENIYRRYGRNIQQVRDPARVVNGLCRTATVLQWTFARCPQPHHHAHNVIPLLHQQCSGDRAVHPAAQRNDNSSHTHAFPFAIRRRLAR